jgi:nucleoside-diphosphate-sugar epimerase
VRVLVTGNRGYLGSVLVPILITEGHEVTGLDCDLFRRCTFVGSRCDDSAATVRTVVKDIRQVSMADLEGHDAVIHLAGLSNDPLGNLDPALTFEINHRAGVRLAQLARAANVRRFVVASTCSVYGASDGTSLTEDSPFEPVTPYAASKLRLEEDILALAERNGFSPVFLRSGTVYGLSPRIRFDLVVNNLVAWACTTGEVFLKSDGSVWRPIVHVADVARTFAAMLSLPADLVHGVAYNVVSSRDNLRVRQIADRVAARIPGCKIRIAEDASGDVRNYRVSGDRLSDVLGTDWFQCDLDSGIDEMCQAFVGARLAREEFEGVRYQRLAHLTHLIEQGLVDTRLFLTAQSPVCAV